MTGALVQRLRDAVSKVEHAQQIGWDAGEPSGVVQTAVEDHLLPVLREILAAEGPPR